MHLYSSCPVQTLAFLPVLTLFLGHANALTQKYCSSENTGSDNSQGTSIYQTTGLCHDSCVDDYAFAVVQGEYCWCSNYVPADTVSVSNCDEECPGYPSEDCGSTDDDLYGYIALTLAASGTKGASSSTATSTATSETSTSSTSAQAVTVTADPETVYHTVTQSASVITESSSKASSTKDTTTSSSESSTTTTSTTESSSSETTTPVTQVTIVTVGGSIVTQTVTSTPSAAASSEGSSGKSSKGVSGGAIAGAVVGSIAGVAALAGLVFFFLRRRRQEEQQTQDAEGSPNDARGPQRNVSTMSKTGLLRSGEKDYTATLPPVNTRNSSHFGTDWSDTITPTSERRNSRPMFHDQRLNPAPFLNLDNGSHASIISLDDNRDYTRTLNVRNPDPPDRTSFDQRPHYAA